MQIGIDLQRLSDDELIRRLGELVSTSRRVEADLVEHIGEVEARRLYAREASPSMFSYCTLQLHLSEAEAYLRITVARAVRRHAVLLAMLRDGRLHLRAIALLAPLLTADNRDALLARATHRSRREVEELVAELRPRPDVPTRVRQLPQRRLPASGVQGGGPEPASRGTVGSSQSTDGSSHGTDGPGHTDGQGDTDGSSVHGPVTAHSQEQHSGIRSEVQPRPVGVTEVVAGSLRGELESTPPPGYPAAGEARWTAQGELCPGRVPRVESRNRAVLQPLSPSRYRVEFTASSELHGKLRRLQALMRSEVPDGDLAAIIDKAVSEKLARLEARRLGRTKPPRKTLASTQVAPVSRAVPVAVRRAVVERDGERCHYVDSEGRRCPERDRLEFHHRHPFAMGGDHRPENVSLLCRAHNRHLAEHDYGSAGPGRREVSWPSPTWSRAPTSARHWSRR